MTQAAVSSIRAGGPEDNRNATSRTAASSDIGLQKTWQRRPVQGNTSYFMQKLMKGSVMTEASLMLKDPVCGMDVNEITPYRTVHSGRTSYFCSAKCKAKFDADHGCTSQRRYNLHLPDAS
jgi:YHS domain-containing protein